MNFDYIVLNNNRSMYINKFKCENPPLSEFKQGVSFCSECNKNVYDGELLDLKEIISSGESVCASVPTSKIAFIERSILTMGIVAASLVTPIDLFAQSQFKTDTNFVHVSSNLYKGVIVDGDNKALGQMKISVYDRTQLLNEFTTNTDGVFEIEFSKEKVLSGELSLKITSSSNIFYQMKLIDLPNDSFDFGQIVIEKIEIITRGDITVLPVQPFDKEDAKPQEARMVGGVNVTKKDRRRLRFKRINE